MRRNDIRLNRQRLSSGRIAKHRNYDELMATHERDKKIKRIVNLLAYILITIILLLLFFMVKTLENKSSEKVQKEKEIHSKIDKGFNQIDFSFNTKGTHPLT